MSIKDGSGVAIGPDRLSDASWLPGITTACSPDFHSASVIPGSGFLGSSSPVRPRGRAGPPTSRLEPTSFRRRLCNELVMNVAFTGKI